MTDTGPSPDGALVVDGGVPLRGEVRVPGDKGLAHRALFLAALAQGPVHLAAVPAGADVAATRALLQACGVPVTTGAAGTVRAAGACGRLQEPEGILDCANSGTTMRLGAGLLAAAGPGIGGDGRFAVLDGDSSLRRRPMGRVVEPLRAMGARIDGRAGGRLAPLALRAAPLHGARHRLEVPSGQVKTALLLAGLQADGVTEVEEPAPSRDHTERMLGALGLPVERPAPGRVRIRAAPVPGFDLTLAGDPSSAAFWVVAATIVPGSALRLPEVLANPGRLAYLEVLGAMGADITVEPAGERLGEPVATLSVRAAALVGTEVTVTEPMIDEVPVLAVAAAFASGTTTFRGAAELAVKESDRLATTAAMLAALGVEVERDAERLVVHGGRPRPARLDAAGDHRIALAAAVAGLALDGRSVVMGWDAHRVSYPGFTDALDALRGGS